MSNTLQQTVEALAKEKGIDPEVIVTAIEDAVLTASRKYYKSTENLRTKFNSDTGQVELFAVRQIVEQVENPAIEISLSEAQQLYGDEAEVGMGDRVSQAHRCSRADRGSDGQASYLPKGTRGRAGEHPRRVQPACRRGRHGRR